LGVSAAFRPLERILEFTWLQEINFLPTQKFSNMVIIKAISTRQKKSKTIQNIKNGDQHSHENEGE